MSVVLATVQNSIMSGIVFDIKRFAVHDGPGIRTTVFMKGCPLSCQWCHNPESISQDICTVAKSVRLGAKIFTEDEVVGREMTVEEVLCVLRKEQIFMEESGGGVTFSGGEPLNYRPLIKCIEKVSSAGISSVVFDRAGNKYHGRIAAVADSARENGLEF